jgi:hypothetical protein
VAFRGLEDDTSAREARGRLQSAELVVATFAVLLAPPLERAWTRRAVQVRTLRDAQQLWQREFFSHALAPAEVLVGPPIKQMVYDMVTRSMLVYSEHVDKRLLVVREDGEVLASYSCHVQGLRPAPTQRNCFILHGPMVSYLVLDKPSERPVTVSNFEGKGFARLLACAGDASFLATSAGQTQVLLTPQDDKLPQKWIEAHAGESL